MFKTCIRGFVAATVVAGVSALGGAGLAEAAYPEKNLTVIIPSSPGGGFDTYARALSRVMEKYLPKGVKVVPKNVSGGGGRKGATAAYKAKADGYTFAVFNVPGIVQPIILGEKVSYDVDKIEWLGSMAFNQYVIVVKKGSPIKSLADIKASKRPIKFTGYGSSGVAANRIICSSLAIKCKIITGYKGNNPAMLAVIRGDGDASVSITSSVANFANAGELSGVVVFTKKADPIFPGVPTAGDEGYDELSNLGLIRAFGAPPGVPADRLAKLTEIFEKSLADPDLAAWAKSVKAPFAPMKAADLRKLMKDQRALLTKYKAALKKKKKK
jgi:tripartite-type tricarboxylate transporter receptor subunit TctC